MNRFKNIVTNILGLIFWGYAIKNLSSDNQDITYIVALIIIGIVLFRFKFSETKKYLVRFLDIKTSRVKPHEYSQERTTETIDPDKPKKPKTKG